jgi:hypothetical protein
MHGNSIVGVIHVRIRRLIIQKLKTSAASDTCSMVRKQRRSICSIYKLIRQRWNRSHMWYGCRSVVRKCGKGEHILIEHYVTRYVNTVRGNMEALVPFVKRTIPKEDALFGPKLQLALVIWTKMRPTSTPKNLKKRIIWEFIEQEFKGGFHL